jgi:hypothetical protein
MNLFGTKLNLWGQGSSVTSYTSTSTGGNNVGSVAADLAGGALESIPVVGKFLSGIVDKLEISKNIGLVSKYGLSSWGAGQSPERIKGQFAKNIYPWYQAQLKSITPENMGAVLTEMYYGLLSNLEYHKHLRKHHANAGSTKKAYEWSMPELQRLLKSVEAIASSMSSNGVQVKIENYSRPIEFVDLKDMSGTIRDKDSDNSPVTFKRFTIDADGVRSLEVDENGQVTKKSGSSGLLALAGIGFAIFKGMK